MTGKNALFLLLLLAFTAASVPGFAESPPHGLPGLRSEAKGGIRRDVFQFYNSRLTVSRDPKKQSLSLGLEFGRIRNGGWSIWNFCTVGKNLRLTAEPVCTFQTAEGGVLVGDVSCVTDQGILGFRFLQFSDRRDLLWLRVRTPPSPDPCVITFSMVPGGAGWNVPGRERILMTSEGEFSLSRAAANFPVLSPGIIATNRIRHEDFGELLTLEEQKFVSAFAPRTANFVSLRLTARPGEHEFRFALGNFFQEPQADACARFLREQARTLSSDIQRIDWDISAGEDSFPREAENVRTLISLLNGRSEEFSRLLKGLEGKYAGADPAERIRLLRELTVIKDQICEQGLAEFAHD